MSPSSGGGFAAAGGFVGRCGTPRVVGGLCEGVGVSRGRRTWRGVKPVAAPSGVAVTTRLRTTAGEDQVLDAVAAHLGRLRRADLAAVSRPEPVDSGLDADERRQVRRERLNARKKALTGQSSARWANAIIAGNDDQYRLARDAQYRHIAGLRAAIATIEARLAAPTGDVLTVSERKSRRKAKAAKGYATQAERCHKLRRLQRLRGELAATERDRAAGVVHVVEGGKRLAHTRHNLDAAGLTEAQWRQRTPPGRSWGSILTTGTSRCAASTPMATQSEQPNVSISTSPVARRAGTLRSVTPSPNSCTSPAGMASPRSRSKT